MTPRIAIPRWRAPSGERMQNYIDSLRRAGARPVLLGPADPLDGCHGLLLTGGVDLDPRLYGERRGSHTQRPNPRRDDWELRALRLALEGDLPVLAVCRGHQLLNVALGGSLLQHIDGHDADDRGESTWHQVSVLPDSLLADIYDGALRVNSRHHQAVTADRLSPRLRAAARAGQVVEGAESRDHRWVLGVQWHPERPELRPAAEPLFRAFVQACRR